MAIGGIRDHIGGVFATIGDRPACPTFRKMLCDQAQLAVTYCGLQITGDPLFQTSPGEE
jgi:uncharacterized protein YyaL (SSP411 family)